jgi:hypothetical protein
VSTKSANQLPQNPDETNDPFATLARGAGRTLLMIEHAALINSIVPHACLIAAVNTHTQQPAQTT